MLVFLYFVIIFSDTHRLAVCIYSGCLIMSSHPSLAMSPVIFFSLHALSINILTNQLFFSFKFIDLQMNVQLLKLSFLLREYHILWAFPLKTVRNKIKNFSSWKDCFRFILYWHDWITNSKLKNISVMITSKMVLIKICQFFFWIKILPNFSSLKCYRNMQCFFPILIPSSSTRLSQI